MKKDKGAQEEVISLRSIDIEEEDRSAPQGLTERQSQVAAHGEVSRRSLPAVSVTFHELGGQSKSQTVAGNNKFGDESRIGTTFSSLGSHGSRRNHPMSPIKDKVSRALHKASARVVNLANNEQEQLTSTLPAETPILLETEFAEKECLTSYRAIHETATADELSGSSLRIFGPKNIIRQRLCALLLSPVTEPLILLLIIFQAVILTIDSSYDVIRNRQILSWGGWTDWALLVVFILYTVEIAIRSIVSGLLINADAGSSSIASLASSTHDSDTHIKALRPAQTFRYLDPIGSPIGNVKLRKSHLVSRAYLRRSFNRIDFVAVLSFWIYLALAITGNETQHHIFVFKAISCMRILRLLNITRGTSTILKSLKKSAPLLVNVATFVGFFWLFMAVIGVQSFKGSFRRHCVWVDPSGAQSNQTQELQFCGGQWENGRKTPFLLENWESSKIDPKGYICPEQSYCVQDQNPYNGTVHFDNVFNSMEMVFVIMSSNTFSTLMYYTMDSDHFVAVLFFVAGIFFLTFWLMSLVIAVVTTSFQVIREEQQSSAFAAKRSPIPSETFSVQPRSKLIRLWEQTRIFWVILVAGDLATQAVKSSSMTYDTLHRIDMAELIFTLVFAGEIAARAFCYLPHWRGFATKSNLFDLFLAIVTCIIQIPVIKNSGSLYRWLTVFQIMRSYRVIRAIPYTRELLLRILGNTSGLLNLMFFLVCVVYTAALVACQLVRGDAAQVVYGKPQEMTFKNIYNSFLAMYQILSSENWTEILYAVQSNQTVYSQAWIGAIFFIVWFVFGQNIIMSMFIAVLQENFEVSEDNKRREQVKAFVKQSLPEHKAHEHSNLTMFSLFSRKQDSRRGPTHQITSLGASDQHQHNVREFLDQQMISSDPARKQTMQDQLQGPILRLWRAIISTFSGSRSSHADRNPFTDSRINASPLDTAHVDASTIAADVAQAQGNLKVQQANYLKNNPSYDKVFWILSFDSSLRRFCQGLVAPSSGERSHATSRPRPLVWYTFSAIMYLCTLAIVVLACYITPIYQIAYLKEHGRMTFTWYTWADLAFTIIFSIEFLIKVCADGFWLTPNAYMHNTWNRIDLFVLATLWINVIADILDREGLSRAFRAFKALRALRLVNISAATKATFHDVLIAGFWNIAGAAIVSITLLIPMAIWGLNLFSGLLFSCNDDAATGLAQCFNEFDLSSGTWSYWSPRAWENPQVYSFDSFGSSLLVLFEIVSQEGWIDVMTSAMWITTRDAQPQQDASAVNALFFILFNLLGAVFVLTLFIAVIIQNYSERSGVAYLTVEQRSWQELSISLKQVRPSRRPVDAPGSFLRRNCFLAVKKKSFWSRFMIAAYCVHVLLLMTEHFPDQQQYIEARNTTFLALNLLYLLNIFVRISGLGWPLFVKSRWNLFNAILVPISLGLNVVLYRVEGDVLTGVLTAEKVFLVLVATNLIPAIDSLDQLFKTTAAALPDLASLMATWLVLFITFAVAFNQIFGLTKFGPNGGDNLNFRTVPKALVVLFAMSCGEGWNAIMHDFAVSAPYCTASSNFFESDCGSEGWAYFLFIAWNIVSMYIFVNIVISLVYNNFSYVYQQASKVASISREDIRRFKAIWAEFDDGTAHIPKDQVARFLSRLEGPFEVSIYPKEYTVRRLLEDSRKSLGAESDLNLLNRRLAMMNVSEIRARRRTYNRLYTELMHRRGSKGISFTGMLLVLAQSKFVDDNKSLGLGEFLHRRSVRLEVDQILSYECLYGVFQTKQARETLDSHLGRADTVRSMSMKAVSERRPSSAFLGSQQGRAPHSRSPSPSTTGRRSWRLGPRSLSPSGSRRPSLATSTGQDNLDYNNLLAGSAWSTAIGGSTLRQTQSHTHVGPPDSGQ